MAAKTRLGGTTATFSKMMERFGIVTVMNAKVYDTAKVMGKDEFKTLDAKAVLAKFEAITTAAAGLLCELDTLKVANISIEGPSKTVTGGQYSNPLIKFGKSARLEMQDALGNVDAIDALCGGVTEYSEGSDPARTIDALHFGEDFNGPRTIIGESFFIDQPTGQQVPVKVIFYQFLPDSIFNLTQDAEGDATVFDMNGDLLTTVIKTYDNAGKEIEHGMFYSIVDGKKTA